MKRPIPLCLLASAAAFPAMLFERLRPIKPAPELVAWQPDRTWYHNAKNWTTESVRADSQWWSKALCFAVVAALLIGLGVGFKVGRLI